MRSVLPHILLLLACVTTLSLAAPQLSESKAPRLGAVASESSICSRIGTDLLLAGGNAADAMVGTTICLGVVASYHTGIGGGGFMLVRAPDGTYEDVDFREFAPAAAWEGMFENRTEDSKFGGLASGVPGELRGLEYLHTKYGKLLWKQVIVPSVKLAREGFKIHQDMIRFMNWVSKNPPDDFLTKDPEWAVDFAPNGTLLGLNDTLTRVRYSNTLQKIANEGADAFYKGPMAEAMIRAVQAKNGTMTMDDLAAYKVKVREPESITYNGYSVKSCGAPASGTMVLSVMKILEGFEDWGWKENLNLSTHRLDEALRFGQAQRTKFGDPDFVPEMDNYESNILNISTVEEVRGLITDGKTHSVAYYNPDGFEILDWDGTSHAVAADASGLAISLTSTVNLLWGSKVMVPETGVVMNDHMNDFSIPGHHNAFGYEPCPANYIRPHKRPQSSCSPLIIEPLTPAAAPQSYTQQIFNSVKCRLIGCPVANPPSDLILLGAAGGSHIPTSTLFAAFQILSRNMTLKQAIDEPRLHDQLVPNTLQLEYSFNNSTAQAMIDKGHNVTWTREGWSSVQGARMVDGVWQAAAERRQVASGGFAV